MSARRRKRRLLHGVSQNTWKYLFFVLAVPLPLVLCLVARHPSCPATRPSSPHSLTIKPTTVKSHFFIDFHCHPSIKAFARSFRDQPGQQSTKIKNETSLWYQDLPSLFDKLKNYVLGLTNFIQSDATSLLQGRVSVVCLSFYPQEKGFFLNKAGDGIISDTLTKLATEFGQERIDHLQALDSYWNDLQLEMAFLKQRAGSNVTINGRSVSYAIARSYADIEAADTANKLGEDTVLFVPTIEGAHVFDQVMDCHVDWKTYPDGIPADKLTMVLQRVNELRTEQNGMIRPFFITFAHHFWNGLCGHEKSLGGVVRCIADQSNGLGQGISNAGRTVLKALLEDQKDANGNSIPRILVDIKHMSRKAREDYFSFLDTTLKGNSIPIIASHAGVTGLSAPDGINQTPCSKEDLFMTESINFYDDELLRIEASGGIVGIQLDERRIGSKTALRHARGNITRRDILFSWSRLVWNQIRHVAELLDMNNRYAWGTMCLGTDFDGIIDPINGYWTAASIDELDDYLLMHAYNYLKEINAPCPLVQAANRNIAPEELVERVMTSNALNFLSKHF